MHANGGGDLADDGIDRCLERTGERGLEGIQLFAEIGMHHRKLLDGLEPVDDLHDAVDRAMIGEGALELHQVVVHDEHGLDVQQATDLVLDARQPAPAVDVIQGGEQGEGPGAGRHVLDQGDDPSIDLPSAAAWEARTASSPIPG